MSTLQPRSTGSILGTCPCPRPVVGSKVSHYASAFDATSTWCLNWKEVAYCITINFLGKEDYIHIIHLINPVSNLGWVGDHRIAVHSPTSVPSTFSPSKYFSPCSVRNQVWTHLFNFPWGQRQTTVGRENFAEARFYDTSLWHKPQLW